MQIINKTRESGYVPLNNILLSDNLNEMLTVFSGASYLGFTMKLFNSKWNSYF